MRRYLPEAAGFFLILFMVLAAFTEVFSFKNLGGQYGMTKFYELPAGSVDLLVIGSSVSYMGISTQVMYDDYGIAAYDLGTAAQSPWGTYHMLIEALKTQRPKVVVFDASMIPLLHPDDGMNESDADGIDEKSKRAAVIETYGMKWSKNRYDAVLDWSPYIKSPYRLLLPYMQYHARYKELRPGDFAGTPSEYSPRAFKNFKGFIPALVGRSAPQKKPPLGVKKRSPLFERSERYLRKIIALSKERGVPLLVVMAPNPGMGEKPERMERANRVADIAREQGVTCLNFNVIYEKLSLDFSKDYADVMHLNHYGHKKYTKWLGKYLKRHFDLPDRRGEAAYESWADDARCIRARIRAFRLKQTTDFLEAAKLMRGKDYIVFVGTDESAAGDAKLAGLIASAGLRGIDTPGLRWIERGKVVREVAGDAREHFEIGGQDVLLETKKDEKGRRVMRMFVAGKNYTDVPGGGYRFIVYDRMLEEVADSFTLSRANGYKCVR